VRCNLLVCPVGTGAQLRVCLWVDTNMCQEQRAWARDAKTAQRRRSRLYSSSLLTQDTPDGVNGKSVVQKPSGPQQGEEGALPNATAWACASRLLLEGVGRLVLLLMHWTVEVYHALLLALQLCVHSFDWLRASYVDWADLKGPRSSVYSSHWIPPEKLPSHVAVVVHESEIHDHSVHKLAQLVLWLSQLGIVDITLYDDKGLVKGNARALMKSVAHYRQQSNMLTVRDLPINVATLPQCDNLGPDTSCTVQGTVADTHSVTGRTEAYVQVRLISAEQVGLISRQCSHDGVRLMAGNCLLPLGQGSSH